MCPISSIGSSYSSLGQFPPNRLRFQLPQFPARMTLQIKKRYVSNEIHIKSSNMFFFQNMFFSNIRNENLFSIQVPGQISCSCIQFNESLFCTSLRSILSKRIRNCLIKAKNINPQTFIKECLGTINPA